MEKRNGFTPKEKEMMMLARETRHGIEVTGMVNILLCSMCHRVIPLQLIRLLN